MAALNSEHGQVWSADVVNDQVSGSAMMLPPSSAARAVTTCLVVGARSAFGVQLTVRRSPERVIVPSILAPPPSVTANWVLLASTGSSKLAVTVGRASTPVAPASGVLPVATGGVVSLLGV